MYFYQTTSLFCRWASPPCPQKSIISFPLIRQFSLYPIESTRDSVHRPEWNSSRYSKHLSTQSISVWLVRENSDKLISFLIIIKCFKFGNSFNPAMGEWNSMDFWLNSLSIDWWPIWMGTLNDHYEWLLFCFRAFSNSKRSPIWCTLSDLMHRIFDAYATK